ncbi:MAG: polyprenyl synthetase family protein [Parachlamydiaceae bacterium]|nr:polyprenyl synthetase family protein [Parachlamydiaceae bacterium]
MSLNEHFQEYSTLIEHHLENLIHVSNMPYRQLFSAARYSVLGGGKRLRPILVLATVQALGGSIQHALSAASAVELVHTYSLIHDDLPCMDDDDFRRNKPSLHKAFSEAHAVLTGDYLLSYAFELLANDPHLQPEQKVKLVSLLAKGCGGNGMIGGQIMDIEAEGIAVDQATLECIHHHKTGALITASIAMGATVANGSEADMKALCSYGNDLGLAFQVMDDIIDVRSSLQKHGKAVSSDVINNKTTYVTLFGREKAESIAHQLGDSAKNHLKSVQGDTARLSELADLIIGRKS